MKGAEFRKESHREDKFVISGVPAYLDDDGLKHVSDDSDHGYH